MVISIVERRSDSVTRVPPSVTKLTVVIVISNDLCLCYFEACWVAHATGEIKHSSGIFPSQRRITIFSGYWRPHLSEHTHILSLLHSVHLTE